MALGVRVCHIITGLETGGAEMMLYRLVSTENLARDHEHVVISLSGPGTLGARLQAQGVTVHCLGLDGKVGLYTAVSRLRRIVRECNPQCVQGWMPHGNLFALLVKGLRGTKVRLFWNVRQSIYDLSRESRGTRYLIRGLGCLSFLTERVVYNSQIGANQHQAIGYRADRTVVIPNGFDLEKWSPSIRDRAGVLLELGLPATARLIGLVGRFDPLKDHRTFIFAFGRVSASMPNIYAVLVGKGVDSSNDFLQSWIKSAGVMGRILLLGERSNVARLTASLDVACSSSISEGFPNAVGEAMSCGIPCVVTAVGESAAIVGDAGIVVPPSDPEAFANALSRVLNLEPAEWRQLGVRARCRVAEHYSLASVTRTYENLYANR